MNALGSFISILGVVAFFVGLVIIVRPIRSLGFSRRLDGALVIIASIAVILLGEQVSPELKQQEATRAAASTAASGIAKPVSKSDVLQNIRIGGFSWAKDGFGTVMKATFVIYNDNIFPVKDITVTCTHAANSGTKIDSNTRTIYERVDARGYFSVVQMNMGFIHSAVTSSECRVTSFSRV